MGKPRKSIKSKKRRCADKQVFETLEAAQEAAYRPRASRNFMTGYKCPSCKKFHFGHVPSSALPR